MRDQLKLLEDLQRHDARLQEYENARKTLPARLLEMKNDLARVEAMLTREQASLAETEKFKRDLDGQLKSDEGNIAKAKSKMQQVKTGKDYMAAQREIEATRRTVGDREEELLKLIDAIEAGKKSVDAHEKDVNELRTHVQEEEAKTQAQLDEVNSKVDAEKAERDALASKVRPDVLKRYGSIRMKRGLAVVPVVGGTCQGCHMRIPPQLYRELQRMTSIDTCPTCNRIIYWDQLMKEVELERGEKDASEPPSAQ